METVRRPAALLAVFAWLLSSPTISAAAARRLDRRIGLLVPNGAAAQFQPSAISTTTTASSSPTKFGSGHSDYRGGQRVNADELVKLGVDADEVQRHVRRLEEDDTAHGRLQQHQPQYQQPRSRQPASLPPSLASAAGFQQMYRGVPKNAEQIRSEHHLMRRYFIRSNRTAACNDGSRAGYVSYANYVIMFERCFILFQFFVSTIPERRVSRHCRTNYYNAACMSCMCVCLSVCHSSSLLLPHLLKCKYLLSLSFHFVRKSLTFVVLV